MSQLSFFGRKIGVFGLIAGIALCMFTGLGSLTAQDIPNGILASVSSPDRNRVAIGGDQGFLQILDSLTGNVLITLPSFPGTVTQITWNPVGTTIAVSYRGISRSEDALRIYNASTGGLLSTVALLGIGDVSWSKSGNYLAASLLNESFSLVILNSSTLTQVCSTSLAAANSILEIKWHPLNDSLVVAGGAGGVFLLPSPTSCALSTFATPGAEFGAVVSDVAYSPNGSQLAVGYRSGHIRIYDVAFGTLLRAFQPFSDYIRVLEWSPDGQYLVSLDQRPGSNLLVHNVQTGALVSSYPRSQFRGMLDIGFSADGTRILFGDVRSLVNRALVSPATPTPTPTPTHTPTPIPPSTLNITVSLGSRPAAGQIFNVVLARSGITPIERLATANAGGVLTLTDIPQAQYTVWIKHPQTLAEARTITLNMMTVSTDFGTFKLGDTSNDNVINLTDFSILAASFGKTIGTVGYDSRADFSGDQVVNITDFSILAASFGQAGATKPSGGAPLPDEPASALPPELTSARIGLRLDTSRVRVNQTFTVTVRIGNSSASTSNGLIISQLNGGEVHLRFDPTTLQVDSVNGLTAGSALSSSLMSQFNNTAGTIDFAAGLFNGTISGEFTLVTIRFRPIASTSNGTTTVQAQIPSPARINLLSLNAQTYTPTITPLSFRITP